MTLKAVKTVSPFEFRSDFGACESAPAEPQIEVPQTDEDRISLKPEEFAGLLMTIRAEGVADAEARADAGKVERLESAISEMRQSLGDLVALMSHIEATAITEQGVNNAAELIRSAAQRIIDGQGDLFSEVSILTDRSYK